MTVHSVPAMSLAQLLHEPRPYSPAKTIEQAGDNALIDRHWPSAIAAYEKCEGARADEKRGWCYVQLEQWTEVVAILGPHRDELSSAGLASLAIASVGGWNKRHTFDEPTRMLFDELLGLALAEEAPAYLAYAALFWFSTHEQSHEMLMTHAKTAIALYPDAAYLRLQLAKRSVRYPDSQPQVYLILQEGLGPASTTEYLWSCALSAISLERWDDALGYLDRAKALTLADGERSLHTAQLLQLKQAEVLDDAGRQEAAIAVYDQIAAQDASSSRSSSLAALRSQLAMACRSGDVERARQALNRWLQEAIVQLPRRSFYELLEGEVEPIHFFDGEWELLDAKNPLTPYQEQLLDLAQPAERGLIRFLFAELTRYVDDDYDKQAFAEAMLQAEQETDSPVILAALACAYATKKKPNWKLAGIAWARYELHRLNTDAVELAMEPLDADSLPSSTAVEAYAKGMTQVFKEAAPSPHLREIFVPLRDILSDAKMYATYYGLATLAAQDSEDSDAIFDAALGAHWCKDHRRAIALYWDVLSREPAYKSALHNLLLLYRSPQYAHDVERVAALVERYPDSDVDKKNQLLTALADARQACRDPQEIAREAVRSELVHYPALITAPLKLAKLPLQDAVTLLTLMRVCDPEDGSSILPPFKKARLFSPTLAHRQGLFRLLQSGLIAVADDTPVNAFNVEDGRVRGYLFDRIWWRISPATIALVQSIHEQVAKPSWPKGWCDAARAVATSIAEEECIQYLMHLAEDRNWPRPDDDAKVRALARSLVQNVSVSHAFYLIYLGAMSASDYKQRLPVNGQQASNVIVLRASQRLETWMREARSLKAFSRSNQYPRSTMAQVFHDEFLRIGEDAFYERIDSLPYPQAKGARAKPP